MSKTLPTVALLALAIPAAQAWELEGSTWAGADSFDNVGYTMHFTEVTPLEANFFAIKGHYQSAFDDNGKCNEPFAFTGTYYENEGVMSFTVAWYNNHNFDCRTTSAYTGVIFGDSDMNMLAAIHMPRDGKNVDPLRITFERQVGSGDE